MLDVSLLERIEFVLENKKWSARKWATLAGLSEATHLSTIMRRLEDDPEADVSSRVLAKLADAANVSMDWLAIGRGSPSGTFVSVERDPRYPSRGLAIAAARVYGYRDDAISKVLAVDSFPVDPGLDYWAALLRAEHEGAMRLLPPHVEPKKRVPARKRR